MKFQLWSICSKGNSLIDNKSDISENHPAGPVVK